MFVEMLFDNAKIFAVGPPHKVEHVADQGNRTNCGVYANIGRHPYQLPFRHAEIACFPHDVGTHGCSDDIAEHRY